MTVFRYGENAAKARAYNLNILWSINFPHFCLLLHFFTSILPFFAHNSAFYNCKEEPFPSIRSSKIQTQNSGEKRKGWKFKLQHYINLNQMKCWEEWEENIPFHLPPRIQHANSTQKFSSEWVKDVQLICGIKRKRGTKLSRTTTPTHEEQTYWFIWFILSSSAKKFTSTNERLCVNT